MKCSLDIPNFLEELSSISPFITFLYFFALITEEGFLISLLFFGTLHSNGYIFPFLLCLSLLFFSQLFVRLRRQPFCPFAFLFLGDGLDHCLLYNVRTSVHSSSGTVSIRSNPLNLFVSNVLKRTKTFPKILRDLSSHSCNFLP